MFATWTSANRIVTQPLTTTFTRQIVPVSGNMHNDSYILYTRIRRKKYKYVAMDRATAVACAMAMNLLYNRFVPNAWKIDTSTHTAGTRWSSIPIIYSSNRQYWKFMTCGVATISKESKDDRYSVDVDVDEELPYRWSCVVDGMTSWDNCIITPWTAFEENPDIVTPRFATGQITGSDFTYDE